MFRPLAWTKTLALVFSSLLSITLVPALMPICLRGKLRPESQTPPRDYAGHLPADPALVPSPLEAGDRAESYLSGGHHSAVLPPRQPVHAGALRRFVALHAERAAGHFDHAGRRR